MIVMDSTVVAGLLGYHHGSLDTVVAGLLDYQHGSRVGNRVVYGAYRLCCTLVLVLILRYRYNDYRPW